MGQNNKINFTRDQEKKSYIYNQKIKLHQYGIGETWLNSSKCENNFMI